VTVVALETFTAADGTICWAGITHADESCDCVRKHPDKWGKKARTVDHAGYENSQVRARATTGLVRSQPLMRTAARDGSVRAITSARSTQTSLSAQTVVRVVMTARGRQDLDEQGYDSLLEQGGGLFGFYDEKRCEIVIDDVTGRVRNNSEGSCLIDSDYIDRMAERHRSTTGYRTVGTFHSHPSTGVRYSQGSRRDMMSPGDEKSFVSWWRYGGEQPFVGLILSKSDESTWTWAGPELHAYTVTRSRGGSPVISRVPVKVEPEEIPRWQQK
jgi:hypothetical protein